MIPTRFCSFVSIFLVLLSVTAFSNGAPQRPEILFLGEDNPEESLQRYRILKQVLGPRGINLTFAENMGFLERASLDRYDALIVQGNREHDELPTSIIPWVRAGGGIVAIAGAGNSFPASPAWLTLIGGRSDSGQEQTFTPETADPKHLISQNLPSMELSQQAYRHTVLASDLHLLQVRPAFNRGETGAQPWSWTRQEGSGRVFYTASGQHSDLWRETSHQVLLFRAIFWAIGDEPAQAFRSLRLPQITHTEPEVQNRAHPEIPMMPLQDALSPADSAAHTQVMAGTRLELFASEPMVVNPIAIDWDERGRAWVVESLGYPNDVPSEPGSGLDRIKILEDTDGDGRADKATLFADGIRHGTTSVFYAGGVLATDGRDIVFLRDDDGDGQADTRRVLATGLSISDTHASTSHFQYGLDNWIYATVGYSGVDMTLDGKKHEFGSSVFRFRPDLSELQHLQRTTNNTWGLGLTEEGDVMGSTANNHPSWILALPSELYANTGIEQSHTPRADTSTTVYPNTLDITQVDQINRYTAAAGHGLYTDNLLAGILQPDHVFVTEPTTHLVGLGTVVPRDSLKATHFGGNNLFASSDAWSAPVAARTGPDGAVWIADWYNPIVQHNVVFRFWNPKFDYDEAHSPYHTGERRPGPGNAYRTPLRDRDHGRIWRVVPATGSTRQVTRLDSKRPASLLAGLRSPSQHTRLHAQRLLIENGNADLIPALSRLVAENATATGSDKPLAAIHAIWTLEGLHRHGKIETAALGVLRSALELDANPLVRRHALLALDGEDQAVTRALPDLIAHVTEPRERLFVLQTAAAAVPHQPIARALWDLATGDSQLDEMQREAVRLAMHGQGATMVTTVLENGQPALADNWQTNELFAVAARAARGPGRPALVSLLGTAPSASRARLEELLGETGDLERPEVELPAHLDAGLKAFNKSCVECHQPDGSGVPQTFPPLVAESERAGGSRETILRVVLGGLHGPVEVAGETYNNVMPGFSFASDDEIAEIVSYVRYAFIEKREDPISPAEVKAIRSEIEARKFIPWTAGELRGAQ